MATTKIDICARALIMIGAQPISSFSDGSTEALVASNIYDDVVLWGRKPLINRIADFSDTISYDLLTGIAPRVPFCNLEESG